MIAARRSSRRIFTIIPVGLVIPDCLVSCVLLFAYGVLRLTKITVSTQYQFQYIHQVGHLFVGQSYVLYVDGDIVIYLVIVSIGVSIPLVGTPSPPL